MSSQFYINSSETWRITKHDTDVRKQMPPENHEGEMVRQSQKQDFVDQDKSTASRNRNKTKKMVVDWSYAEKTPIQHHQTSPDMESTRDGEKRTAKKHMAARHGVGS